MKRLVLPLILIFAIACSETDLDTSQCSIEATVVDLTELDGCGYILQLDNGQRLEPIWSHGILFCGTPPLPKEITDDPLWGFNFFDGQRVKLSYYLWDGATACMAGTPIKVTCIEDIGVTTGSN